MRIRDLKIRNRLVAGFLIVGLLAILLGGISLSNAVRLGSNVEDIYNHPFTVSNAVLRIKVNIYDIHRKMKEKDTTNPIAIYPAKTTPLPLCQIDQSQQQHQKQQDDRRGP